MTATDRRPGTGEVVAVAALAAASAGLLWFITGPHGIGLTNDSIAYLDMARSLDDGLGLRRWTEDPVTTWPFLFPLLVVATARVSGLALLDAGRLLASAASVLLAFATWGVLRRTVASLPLRLAAVVAVVFGTTTIVIARVLLTDQLFAAGTVAFLLVLLLAVDRGTLRWVAAAVVLAGALFTVRYVGALLVPVGAAVLLVLPMGRSHRGVRVRNAIVFGAAGMVVPVAYALRNRAVSTAAFQQRPAGEGATTSSYAELPRSLGTWIIGRSGSGIAAIIGLVGAVVVVGAAVALVAMAARSRLGTGSVPDSLADPVGDRVTDRAAVAAAWLLLAAATLALRAVVAFDLDDRTLLVLFAPAVVIVAAAIDVLAAGELGSRGAGGRPRARVGRVAVAVFVVAAVGSALLGVRAGLLFRSVGGGYAATRWTPTIDELRAADLPARLPAGCDRRSNDPPAAYLGGLATSPPPGAAGGPAVTGPLCLVWIELDRDLEDAAELDQLRTELDLEPALEGDTFVVYVSRG